MKLFDIFESEETDRDARLEADVAYQKVRSWLEYNKDDLVSTNGKFGGQFPDGFYLPHKISGLRYIFLPVGKQKYVGGLATTKTGQKIMILTCLLGPNNFTYIETRMSKKNFIHEYIHYILSKKGVDGNSAAKLVKNPKDYYNDHNEINSYYQEAAHEMVSLISAIIKSKNMEIIQEWKNKSIKELMDFTKDTEFNKTFLLHLTPESMKAVDKRLYRFIEQTIKPMLEKALTE